jgi:hypothetical protein
MVLRCGQMVLSNDHMSLQKYQITLHACKMLLQLYQIILQRLK